MFRSMNSSSQDNIDTDSINKGEEKITGGPNFDQSSYQEQQHATFG